ncbi:MAG: NADH-quinone oxidoreductase subunit N, partial [Anaerolineales bacterium]
MTIATILPLAPLLSLAATILLVLFAIAFYRNHLLTAWLSLAGVTFSALMLLPSWNSAPLSITPLLRIDPLGLLWFALLLFAALVVIVISYIYLSRLSVQREEYYLLLLLAVLGGGILTVANHFASLFLGLEILSVSLYALIGYLRDREHSIEAAVKYLILAAASAAFLLFGIALIYADQGTLQFDHLDFRNLSASLSQDILLLVGFGMLFVGIGYKLAVVPFHMWTPDVYQGAPAPVAGFIATVSKAAVFAVLLRLSQASGYLDVPVLALILGIIAAFSMLMGNLLALLQDNVKRILAYSSIANLGYMLVAFLAFSTMSVVAATFYFTAYTVTILAAFFVV